MTDPTIQKAQENRTVEGWLLHWEDRLLSFEAAREEVLEGSRRPDVSSIQAFRKSDVTSAKAVELAALADQEPWLAFIKDFEASLGSSTPHLLVVLRLRRQYRDYRGRRGWVSPCQARFPNEMAAITGQDPDGYFRVSRNTFHGYWREVVDLAAREAIRKGLL